MSVNSVGKTVTDAQKFSIIQSRVPASDCIFLSRTYVDKRRKGGETVRRLNPLWFTGFPFIAYFQYCQGIFVWHVCSFLVNRRILVPKELTRQQSR